MNPKSTIDNVGLEQCDDGEIIFRPFGVVFHWKKVKRKQRDYFFYTYRKDMYSIANLTNLLFIIPNFGKTYDPDRQKIRKNICWYLEIKKTVMEVVKTLPSV